MASCPTSLSCISAPLFPLFSTGIETFWSAKGEDILKINRHYLPVTQKEVDEPYVQRDFGVLIAINLHQAAAVSFISWKPRFVQQIINK